MKRLRARFGLRFRLESVAYGLLHSGAAVKVSYVTARLGVSESYSIRGR